MTTTSGLLSRSRTATDVARPTLPILIQVPALRPSTRGSVRPRAARRRLRKEVRLAGLTMMSALPMGLLALILGGARPPAPTLVEVTARATAELAATPRVTLSFEPTPGPESDSASGSADPVAFPGYLLPVDGPEDPAYEGR